MNEQYNSFINSSDWKNKRNEIIMEKGLVCEECGNETENHKLNLHHSNYDQELGTEIKEDLILLCVDCHNRMHMDVECFEEKKNK